MSSWLHPLLWVYLVAKQQSDANLNFLAAKQHETQTSSFFNSKNTGKKSPKQAEFIHHTEIAHETHWETHREAHFTLCYEFSDETPWKTGFPGTCHLLSPDFSESWVQKEGWGWGRGGGKRSEIHLPSLDFSGPCLRGITAVDQFICSTMVVLPISRRISFFLFLNTQEHDSFQDPTQSLAIFCVISPHDKAMDMQVILKNTLKIKLLPTNFIIYSYRGKTLLRIILADTLLCSLYCKFDLENFVTGTLCEGYNFHFLVPCSQMKPLWGQKYKVSKYVQWNIEWLHHEISWSSTIHSFITSWA